MIRVYYSNDAVVKTVRGEAFVRRGDSKHKLSPDEVRQLQADKGELSFEQREVDLEYPHAFDERAISQFCAGVLSAKTWSHKSNEDVLELLRLGKIDGLRFRPNLACALLFAKDPRLTIPGCRIRFLRFEGEHEGSGQHFNPVRDEFIDGTVQELIEFAARTIKSQIRTFSRLGKDGKFYTSPEYPDFAWYEAVVNACAHRSYGNGMKNMNIFVKMFDDRLVVESPGPFPPFVTPNNIYDQHHPRNPFLMEAMYYLKFVRCAHEGTRRIRDIMLQSQLPAPEFCQEEVGHSQVRVTLRNNIKQRTVWIDADVSKVIGETIARGLSDDQRRIINFVAEHGKVSVSEVQRLTQRSWPSARNLIRELEQMAILERVPTPNSEGRDRDPGVRYVLRSPGNGAARQ